METRNPLLSALKVETDQYPTTENGMATNDTSNSACLDLFFKIGAARNMDKSDMLNIFEKALLEDQKLASSVLLWGRDPRGGAGERKVPRYLIQKLHKHNPSLFHSRENFDKFMLCGRADDLFELAVEDAIILSFYVEDIKEIVSNKRYGSLLLKWIPRNEKNPFRQALVKVLGMNHAEFRKNVLKYTKVVENHMCAKEWNRIEYDKVPSRASLKYRKAFERNDEHRYMEFLDKVESGEAKINTGVLFPYDIVVKILEEEGDTKALELMWKNLDDVVGDVESNAIVMADTSGSMTNSVSSPRPIDISISLAIYMAERLKGPFKDHFITFESNPSLISLEGLKTLKEKVEKTYSAPWGGSTNIEAAFNVLLDTAIQYNISPADMPDNIIIVSDMEFDSATTDHFTSFDMIRNKYKTSGYEMPAIVYWNADASHIGNLPVRKDDEGTLLVSGASPNILKSVFKGDVPNPYDLMYKIVNVEKYDLAD